MDDYKTAPRPAWLLELCRIGDHRTLTGADIAAVNQGGCASGAFMPAVTYVHARTVMGTHGNEILNFVEEHCGLTLAEIATDHGRTLADSWDGLACVVCSIAVEAWCAQFEGDWNDDD